MFTFFIIYFQMVLIFFADISRSVVVACPSCAWCAWRAMYCVHPGCMAEAQAGRHLAALGVRILSFLYCVVIQVIK